VKSQPLWIPVDALRLFGVLHEPVTRARAAVVVCAPILHEYARSHRLFAVLAHELQVRGVAVLRFDYRGTGDSEGDDDAFSMRHAVRDAGKAIDVLRARFRDVPLIMLGVRVGALIAAAAAIEGRADRLWLWQPVVDGAAYLQGLREFEARERQSPMRYRIAKRADAIDDASLMGFLCSRDMLDELAGANWSDAGIARSSVTLLDAMVDGRSPAHARHVPLATELSAWAEQLDMTRIALGPIRALAAELADPVAGA